MDTNTVLDELESEIRPVAEQPIAKLNYSHRAIIDYILANPGTTQNAVAEHFGYTASWLSTMMASDAFKVQMATRAEELVDPILKVKIKENFEAIVKRSQEILMAKLAKPVEFVSDNLALRSMELAGRAAGYGARDDAAVPPVRVDIHTHLEGLADGLTTLLRRKRAAIEGEVVSDDGTER